MKLPSNTNIIESTSSLQGEVAQRESINPEQWLANPASWDRRRYVEQILDLLDPNPTLATTSKVFMLASQVETFVTCQLNIKQHGLTISQNNGVTIGQNPHFKIADAALYRAVQLMKELGLTVDQKLSIRNQNPELLAFLAGA
jgi:phage terminase small subunit